MEDLTGLNFSSATTAPNAKPKSDPSNPIRNTNYISPIPSRAFSPNYNVVLSQTNSGTKGSIPPSASKSKPDSFASLSAFSGISRTGQPSNASLEQQRLAREKEKRDAVEKEKRNMDVHFGADEFWEKHSRQSTPTITMTKSTSDVDLSMFSSDAPVNTESYFPPPKDDVASDNLGTQDPFDMSGFTESFSSGGSYHPSDHSNTTESDDILGILAQPVETFTKPKSPSPKPEGKPPQDDTSDEENIEPRDKAIAAIVEMGFSIGQATKALSQTQSGLDVQAALDNLLSRPSSTASSRLEQTLPDKRQTPDLHGRHRPEPQRQQQPKDISQIAGGMGASFLKGAESLWKSGRDKVNTLIQEYQGDTGHGDANVPKWMRDQRRYGTPSRGVNESITDEAKVLEVRDTRRTQRTELPERPNARPLSKDRLSLRKQIDEEAEMGYRSSARRRVQSRTGTPSQDPPSRTATPPTKLAEADLFSATPDPPQISSQRPSRSQTPQLRPIAPSKPSTPKPERTIPPISDAALSASHTARQKGSEAFKLGDYTLALTHYTSALTHLPPTHPQRIIVLSNRAITNLKLGDAKSAIVDCEDLLTLVGPTRGEGEIVNDLDGPKNMRDIWAKGVLRRASALEMQEKYSEALEMWKIAVDAGIGGSQSLDGRRRCESALGIKPQPTPMTSKTSTPLRTPTPARSSTPVVRPRPIPRPKGPSAAETLAQVNAAAAAEEDEKLRLYDTVNTKVVEWQNGKESNLRALLSSLDLILWQEAGWKKVNMAELVVANKVKIVYMKAIAKVHPDKISTGATTEQRMIAAAVFARLNGAWAVFKEQNNL